jgi:RimJ/RimL family protein N-acetyltransferase
MMPEKNHTVILETPRLYLREMTQNDLPVLAGMLQDPIVMAAYEHDYTDQDVQDWLDKELARYKESGYGMWAVIEKKSGEMVGQCGLTIQDCGEKDVLEVGYLFLKAHWGKGYATEAAIACKNYAFEKLGAKEVFSIIRDTNVASQNVARKNGMELREKVIKHFYGKDLLHFAYSAICP